jgi:hypothetical protein
MAKIGDGVPRLIDKAVDFMASSQAFMEYLKKSPRLQHVPRDIPRIRKRCFCSVWNIIVSFTGRPATRRSRNQSVDFWKAFLS